MIKKIIENKEKKVEYIELIYDLIFVYIIGRNNSLLHNITGGFFDFSAFASYVFCTLAVIQIWTFTTYYINVYGKKSIREHISLFINMFLLYFMAQGTGEHWRDYVVQYHIAWALILVNIGIQYLFEYFNHTEPVHKKRSATMATILFCEAVAVILSLVVYSFTSLTYISIGAILLGVTAVVISSKHNCSAVVDFAHLSERIMLYVVFTFGEMIIAGASYFEGKMSFSSVYFALMAFLIVAGLFLSYGIFYDNIINKEMQTNGIAYMISHIVIIFALNNITSSLEFMRDEEVALIPKISFLIISFTLYYIFLFISGVFANKKGKADKRLLIVIAASSVIFSALMLILRNNMYFNIALSVVYVFSLFLLTYYIVKKKNNG